MAQAFGDYQNEIYFNGLAGVTSKFPMKFADLEERAAAALSPSVWSYVAGGAGDEFTQRATVTAFTALSKKVSPPCSASPRLALASGNSTGFWSASRAVTGR